MAAYVTPRISDERPETVIIQGGGNDLRFINDSVPVETIADHVIEAGMVAKRYNVSNILIGGVTTRKRREEKDRCEALNEVLLNLCREHGFIFIDNSDIEDEHLYLDGVHLNDRGTKILADNYLNSLCDVHQST